MTRSPLVITGATGYLGRQILDELETRDELANTLALCRTGARDLMSRGIDVRVGDLSDPDWLRMQLPEGSTVLHLAGKVEFTPGDAKSLYDLHVESTRALVDAALATHCKRFVLMSSSGTTAVSKHPHAWDERAHYPIAIIAKWPYYASKMFQERLVLDACARDGLPAVVINPSLLLGPGDRRGGSTQIISDYLTELIPVAPGGGPGVVDVRDVAVATCNALTMGQVGHRYFLGGWNGTFSTFFQVLGQVSDRRSPMLTAPRGPLASLGGRLLGRLRPAMKEAMDPAKLAMASHYWYVDWAKAAAELDFQPRSLERTLRDTVSDLRMPY